MYERHFGLQSDPFRLSPSSRPCYEHKTYRRALAYLSYALGRREGVLMLTGTPGTGKTSVIREFVGSVSDPDLGIEQIVCSTLDGEDLLRAVALRYGLEVEGQKKAVLFERLAERLSSLREHGRRPLLIIDEAQGLTRDALEEVRLLTNLQRGDEALLQVFLAGQPALKDTVRSPGLEQLHQRLIVACRLDPLGVEEVEPYVAHCLAESGLTNADLFAPEVYELVHGESFGIPRRINLIMSRLLLHGLVHDRSHIGARDARTVLRGLRSEGLLSSQAWKGDTGDDTGDHEEKTDEQLRA